MALDRLYLQALHVQARTNLFKDANALVDQSKPMTFATWLFAQITLSFGKGEAIVLSTG